MDCGILQWLHPPFTCHAVHRDGLELANDSGHAAAASISPLACASMISSSNANGEFCSLACRAPSTPSSRPARRRADPIPILGATPPRTWPQSPARPRCGDRAAICAAHLRQGCPIGDHIETMSHSARRYGKLLTTQCCSGETLSRFANTLAITSWKPGTAPHLLAKGSALVRAERECAVPEDRLKRTRCGIAGAAQGPQACGNESHRWRHSSSARM